MFSKLVTYFILKLLIVELVNVGAYGIFKIGDDEPFTVKLIEFGGTPVYPYSWTLEGANT